MRNPKAFLMILAAVVSGLVAVFFATRWIERNPRLSTNQIVVATADIDLGTRLSPNMYRLSDWPADSIPQGAIRDPKVLDDRVVRSSVMKGEPILESKLAPLGTKGGLSAVIDVGKRAMTVRVNDVIGVAGFALPGNYVDVLVNAENDSSKAAGKGKVTSMIVLQHILVLAVAQEASREESKPKVVNAVTLEVTPEQAEKLDLAKSVGSLTLVLRNQVDSSRVSTGGITENDLFSGAKVQRPEEEPKAVKPSPPRPRVRRQSGERVEIIKGTEKSYQNF